MTYAESRGAQEKGVGLTAALLALACWLVYVMTAGASLTSGDAVSMYEEAKSIVDRGAFDVPPSQSTKEWRGPDGRYYTAFGLGQPLFDIPFLLAGRVVARATRVQLGDPEIVPKAAVALGNTIPAALSVGFTFLLAFRLSGHARASLFAAISLAFGTLIWPYSKFGFNAALPAFGIASGVYGLAEGWCSRRSGVLAGAGAALGVALLTRTEFVVAAFAGLAWLAWVARAEPRRARLITSASAGILGAVALFALHNWIRYGTPYSTGYYPTYSGAGIPGFLFSPSGALLLYSPVAVVMVALVQRLRSGDSVATLLALVIVLTGIFLAAMDSWLGTRSYGPRYLVPLLPLMVAPAALWWANGTGRTRCGLTILCVASVLTQIPAIAVDFTRVGIEAGQPPQTARIYSWQWSPLRLNATAMGPAVARNLAYLRDGTRPAVKPSGPLQARVAFSLDFWWLYLYYLGVLSRAAALGVAGVLLGTSGMLVRIVFARTRTTASMGT